MNTIQKLKACAIAFILTFALKASAQSNITQNNLIQNGGFDSGSANWSYSSQWGNFFYTAGTDTIASLGGWYNDSVWQASSAVFKPNTAYTLTVRVRQDSGNMTGVNLSVGDATLGWANVTNQDFLFPAGYQSLPSPPWMVFSLNIDTNMLTSHLGDNMTASVNIAAGSSGSWYWIDWVQLAPTLPYFTTQPLGVTNYAGAAATLNCSAIGAVTNSTGPGSVILYQWYQNGNPLLNATNTSLAFVTLNATNGGNYYVVATGPYGSSQSGPAILDVLPANPPIVTQAPVSQSAYINQTVQFLVTVAGTPPFYYQWSSNSVALAGATNATLTLSNISVASAGNYAVTITNQFGRATTNATLAVITPTGGSYESAAISLQPQVYLRYSDISSTNLVFNEGTLGFAANAVAEGNYVATTGPLPPSYPNFEATNNAIQLDGSSADTVIPPLNLSSSVGNTITMSGWIYCFGQQVNSYTGILFERGGDGSSGLQIQTDGSGNNILDYDWSTGNHYTFNSGLVIPNYQWCFVALVITPSGATIYLQDGTSMKTAVDTTAEGVCTFAGTTHVGWDSADSRRHFNGIIDETAIFSRALSPTEVNSLFASAVGLPPEVVTDPVGVTNYTGRAFVLSPVISGAPPLSFQWYKNSSPISGATNYNYAVASAGTGDTGNYYLHVSNTAGSTNTDPVAVAISTSAPFFTVLPQGATVWAGVPTTLSGSANGSSPISYQWLANNVPLLGQTNSSLTIADPEATTAYVLQASNLYGSTNSPSVTLTVQNPTLSDQMLFSTNANVGAWINGNPNGYNPVGDYVGMFFTTGAKARQVTHLGYWDDTGTGTTNGHNVGIFLGSTPVATVYVPPGSAPFAAYGWRWVPLAQPVTLLPNTTYSIWGDTNTLDYSPNAFFPNWNTAYIGNNTAATYISWNWDASPPFVFPDYPSSGTMVHSEGWNNGKAFGNVNLGSFPMTMTQAGSVYQINWTLGTLESATNVAGPYTPVSGATSPYTMPLTGPAVFYRVQLQ